VDSPDGADSDGDVDMAREGEDGGGEDEKHEDEEEDEVDEDEEEDKDEDDGKEPRTIGQGETINTSADDVDTMIDDQPILLPVHCQEMRKRTPRRQRPAPAPRPNTLDSHLRP